jgi:hypothetical protein
MSDFTTSPKSEAGFFSYWWRVTVRSAKDAGKFSNDVGIAPIKLLVAFFLVLLACMIGAWFLGEAVAERILWALGTLLAGLGLFFFVLMIFVARTPWILEHETIATHKASLDEEQEKNAKLLLIIKTDEDRHQTERMDLMTQVQTLKTQIDDTPVSLAEVKALFQALATKGKELSPNNFADCSPWLDLCEKIFQICLGDHVHQPFEMPDFKHMTDNASNANNKLKEWANWVNGSYQKLQADQLTTKCTKGVLKGLKSEINAL